MYTRRDPRVPSLCRTFIGGGMGCPWSSKSTNFVLKIVCGGLKERGGRT